MGSRSQLSSSIVVFDVEATGSPTERAYDDLPVRRTMGRVRVSTRGDYVCRALLSLALHDDGVTPTSVRDIAERTGLPQPYLEQILLALKGAGLVRSKRGVGGATSSPAPLMRSHSERSSLPSTGRSSSATSAGHTRTAPATTRGSASSSTCGPTCRGECVIISIRSA